jgi:hypothetical protein
MKAPDFVASYGKNNLHSLWQKGVIFNVLVFKILLLFMVMYYSSS